MSIKGVGAKIFAKIVRNRIKKWAAKPEASQKKVFSELIKQGGKTQFGRDHDFANIHDYADYCKRVPVRDYEALRPWIDRVVEGKENIVWPGKPIYFAKTSGTTSGAKYIPITEASMPFHIQAARNAILCYVAETGNTGFVDGKMIFLQGSPIMEEKNGIPLGRLSGIVAHYVPSYLQKNRMPSWETNCIEDWESKVAAIVEETRKENMTVISGIPSWVQMYFELLQERTGKKVGDLFPEFNLFIYGGVNYEPYRQRFEELIGRRVDSIELFPASEGFFAYQDSQKEPGMLLLLNHGIFYEFIRASEFFDEDPERLTIGQVELHENYVMIISTNAGLWGYNLGDTVQFVSKDPYRVIVSGRIKHFISAFGEHVIAKEVEYAIKAVARAKDLRVREFTVAPQVNPPAGELPFHEWFVEFEEVPENLEDIALLLDREMQQQNTYYDDLIRGKVLTTLKIVPLRHGAFKDYMKKAGKLGGQNKVQRLANDRKLADGLAGFRL